MIRFQDERDVNRYVEEKLKNLKLELKIDFNDQRNMSDYLKEALKGSSKTENKSGMGVPDFTVEKYTIPVIIENKMGIDKLQKLTKSGISKKHNDVANFAVNGAVSYARHMIHSGKYDSVIAIGIAGDTEEDLSVVVYYVFGFDGEPKLMDKYATLDFLENEETFNTFISDAVLTEEEKHEILIKSQEELQLYANRLNKLMNDHSIGVAERVIYVSGMLLSMQDIVGNNGEMILEGLIPQDLSGTQTARHRDGVKILTQIDGYLTSKNVPDNKKRLMLASFDRIAIDVDRDRPAKLSPLVSKDIKRTASTTRQIFQYVYDNVFTKIAGTAGHLDIIGEMYSIFLKYALGDGKEIGIVLTPPYITRLMAQLLDVNKDSRVLDVATGSAGFLISCMELMIEEAVSEYGKGTTSANKKIAVIMNEQLMGVENDPQMYTLAATNMIMRGDGSAKIEKGSSFDQPKELYENFGATVLLLNPPFTYRENGMPFLAFGLKHMQKGGKAAIIIQDSAGSGRAVKSNKEILRKNRLIASIKMPGDLFVPYAGVQTSIYVFEVGVKHNVKKDVVKFIDFRQDGYKRTQRRLYEIDSPKERYADIPIIFSMGLSADKHPDFHNELWDLSEVYVENTISNSGADWNFEQHKKVNTKPIEADFVQTVGEYLAWQADLLIQKGYAQTKGKASRKPKVDGHGLLKTDVQWGKFRAGDLFEIKGNPQLNKESFVFSENGKYPYFTRTLNNNGILGYVEYLDNEHKIKGNSLAIGMLGMRFFYMKDDFYAGQFTKTAVPQFKGGLNRYRALYFCTVLNKFSPVYKSELVREFEDLFKETYIQLPIKPNKSPDFEYMEAYIAKIELDYIAALEAKRNLEISAIRHVANMKES